MATRGSLSRTSSAAAAAAPADVIRLDDPARLPLGVTPGSILNIGPVVAGQRTGQNHFAVQVAPDGAAVATHTQLEIATGYEELPYFTAAAADTAVQLRASVAGPTTSGSSYARCELREQDLAGTDMAFDAKDSGTHTLHGRSRITHLMAVKPEVVIAQLHNGSSDRVAIRTQLVSGTLRMRIRINGSTATLDATSPVNPGGTDLVNAGASPWAAIVGVEFEWKIEVINGTVRVYWVDMVTPVLTSTALVSTGTASWYFKTGCYLQSQNGVDGDSPTDFGSVELRDLSHWHTGWPTNATFYAVPQHAATHAPAASDGLNAYYPSWQNIGAANGVAGLDSGAKVPVAQLPVGTPSGVAGLDAGGKVPQAQLPAVAIVDYLGVAASQAAMLALTGQRGDWCTRTDQAMDYQLIADDPTQLASWRAMTYPSAPVSSVNGRTGAVTGVQDTSGKDAAGGYAGLDANGRISPAEMALVANPIRTGSVSTSLVSDASTAAGNLINLTLTGNATLGLSNPTDHQVVTYHLLASGAARTVTWDSSVIVPTGLKTTSTIPSGAVLVVTLEYVGNRGTPKWLLTRQSLSDGSFAPFGLGIIARNSRLTAAASAAAATLRMTLPAALLAGRLYRIRGVASGILCTTASLYGRLSLVYTTDGSTPTTASTGLNQTTVSCPTASQGYAALVEGLYVPASNMTFTAGLVTSGNGTAPVGLQGSSGAPPYGTDFTIEDLGIDPGSTGTNPA